MFQSKLVIALLATGLSFGVTLESAHADNGVASWNGSCLSSLKKYYYKGRGWKALAVSNIYLVGSTEFQSCNDVEGYSTRANAITVAMNGCRAELRKGHAPKSAYCRVTLVSK